MTVCSGLIWHVCVYVLSHVQIFATPWTVVRWAPLSAGILLWNTGLGAISSSTNVPHMCLKIKVRLCAINVTGLLGKMELATQQKPLSVTQKQKLGNK